MAESGLAWVARKARVAEHRATPWPVRFPDSLGAEYSIRLLLLSIPLALALLLAAPAQAAAKCPAKYDRADFHRIAGKAYDGRHATSRHERRTLARVVRCQKRPRASARVIAKHRRSYRRHHLRALELRSIAPYDCGSHGRFAVPCSIVYRESHYSWSAYNASSGALGPYQFLGWRVPWPVRSAADKLAHHRMAARLWAGGAGASHWGGY